MLVIDGDGEVLVPFVDHICRRVDLDARVIEIEPVPGLLELNRPVRR
jgi:ribosomal 30S subunit maturation factor RimM